MVRRIPGAGNLFRPKALPKRSQKRIRNTTSIFHGFRLHFGSLWAPFGSLLAPFWLPFGALWFHFGSLWLSFGFQISERTLWNFSCSVLGNQSTYNCLLCDFLFFECQHRQYLPAWRIESTRVKARHPRTHRLTWNGRKSWGAAVTLCVFNGFWKPFRHRISTFSWMAKSHEIDNSFTLSMVFDHSKDIILHVFFHWFFMFFQNPSWRAFLEGPGANLASNGRF